MSHCRKGLTAVLVLGFVLLVFPPDASSALYNLPATQPVTVTAPPADSLSSGTASLHWNTDVGGWGTSFNWWGGPHQDWDDYKHKHRRGLGHDHHDHDKAVVPIPNAAWLLGSGVVALFVLKRKRSTT